MGASLVCPTSGNAGLLAVGAACDVEIVIPKSVSEWQRSVRDAIEVITRSDRWPSRCGMFQGFQDGPDGSVAGSKIASTYREPPTG